MPKRQDLGAAGQRDMKSTERGAHASLIVALSFAGLALPVAADEPRRDDAVFAERTKLA